MSAPPAEPRPGSLDEIVRGSLEPPELLPTVLAQACAAAMNVDAAGLSLVAGSFRLPLAGSNALAARAESMQFTYGEGPCLDAARLGRVAAVAMPELLRRWPSLGQDLQETTPFRAVVSMPIPLPDSSKGAIDLYLTDETALGDVGLGRAVEVGNEVAAILVSSSGVTERAADPGAGDEPTWLNSPSAKARGRVWIAIGLLMARSGSAAPELLARMRAYCYLSGRLLDEVAAALVDGSLAPGEILV